MFQAPRRSPALLAARAGILSALALSGLVATTAIAQPAGSTAQPRISVPGGKPGANQPASTAAPRDPSKAPPAAVDQSKVKVSDNMTVDIHVQGEEIANILEMLAIQSQKNIVTSKNVQGKIPSLNLYSVTFYEALDAILHVNGYGYVEQGNFIYVYTTDELVKLQQQLMKRSAKIIKLNYISATDAAEFVKPMLGVGSEIKTPAKTEAFAVGDAPGGKDDTALSSTIVVIDYEENIAAIEKLLAELDTRPAQVLIETTVLSTRLAEANAFGVDFSVIGSVNFVDFATATAGGPLGVANALIQGAPAGVSPADNAAVGATSTVGGTKKAGGFKFAFISDPVSVFVRALDEVGDTATLANPKLLTLNRQSSSIVVGQRIPYVSTTQTDTSNTQTVQFLDTGVQLYFRPFVLNNGQIRMEVKPQLSDAEIISVRGPSGVVDAPRENKQQVTTNVIVPDGSTVVIGGLFRETTVTSRSQVPGLGSIPVIGEAFKGHDDSIIREEIIFCVTPSVVNDNSMLSQGEDSKNWIERVRAGSRQQLLPWSRERMTATLNVDAERAAREGDYAKAENLLERSLSLNPLQPEAIALRERVTARKEIWPSRSRLTGVLTNEIDRRALDLPLPTNPPERGRPYMHVDLPTEPVAPTNGKPRADNSTPDRSGTSAGFTSQGTVNNDPSTKGEAANGWRSGQTNDNNSAGESSPNAAMTPSSNPQSGGDTFNNSNSSNTFNTTGAASTPAANGQPSGSSTNAAGEGTNSTSNSDTGTGMNNAAAATNTANDGFVPNHVRVYPEQTNAKTGYGFNFDPSFDPTSDEPASFWVGPWYKGFYGGFWTPFFQSSQRQAAPAPFVTVPTEPQK